MAFAHSRSGLVVAALLLLTIGNRVRQGLAELAASRRGRDDQA